MDYAAVMEQPIIDEEQAWVAFERRDRSYDGRFVGAVRTTGIYCKPSCPARHPRREHVTFYADPLPRGQRGFAPVFDADRTKWGATAKRSPRRRR